jgi:hypothetical protein
MNPVMELPGLERLMEVCHRLELQVKTAPPGHTPLRAGTLIAGLPLDPVLAVVYARLGFVAFATDVAGIVLYRSDDEERELEEDNERWIDRYRKQLALPTFVFAGEPMMAYHYATVPSLADEQGRQPVVWVDVYEEPYAVPVASNVDRFFDAYSRYLEALMALPNAREEGASLKTFPWGSIEIIGRDGPLVEMIHEGRFDSLMTGVEARGWAHKVAHTGMAR